MPELPSQLLLLLPEFLSLLAFAGLGLSISWLRLEGKVRLLYMLGGGVVLIAILSIPVQYLYLPEASPLKALWLLPSGSSKGILGNGLLTVDSAGIFFKTLIGLIGLTAIIWKWNDDRKGGDENIASVRFLTGIIGAILGGLLLVGANDLFLIWGGVELLVRSFRLIESGEVIDGKEHQYSGLFSAMSLFGIVLLYGLFGTTELFAILTTLSTRNADIVPVNSLLIALLFLFGGMLAQLASVAQTFLRDRSTESRSLHIPLFLIVVLAGYMLLFRLTTGMFPSDLHGIRVGTLLMVIGSLIGVCCGLRAVGTDNLYRGICLSAGAQLGISFSALAPHSVSGVIAGTTGMLLLLPVTVGIGVGIRGIAGVSNDGELESLRHSFRMEQPSHLLLGLLLLSLAGVPFSGFFLSRFFLFGVLIEWDRTLLWNIVPGILISILLLYAHGRWLYALYLRGSRQSNRQPTGTSMPQSALWLLLICAGVVLASGFPEWFRLLWNSVRFLLGYLGE